VLQVPRKVDQDIYAVKPDSRGNFAAPQFRQFCEYVARLNNALLQQAFAMMKGIAEDLEAGAVAQGQMAPV
jgi:hypothetical protein